MIRVNLLAARQRGLAASSSAGGAISLSDNQRAQELLKRLAIIAIIPVALFFVEREIIPKKIDERMAAKRRLDELRGFNGRRSETTNKIGAQQRDAEKYEAQLNALKKLKHSQFYELRIIDLIQDIIPDRTWVTDIRFTKAAEGSTADNRLELNLSTTSDSEDSVFFSAINQKTDYFIEALPTTDKKVRADNPKIKDFSLSITLKKELPSLKHQWDNSLGPDGSLPANQSTGSKPPASGDSTGVKR